MIIGFWTRFKSQTSLIQSRGAAHSEHVYSVTYTKWFRVYTQLIHGST